MWDLKTCSKCWITVGHQRPEMLASAQSSVRPWLMLDKLYIPFHIVRVVVCCFSIWWLKIYFLKGQPFYVKDNRLVAFTLRFQDYNSKIYIYIYINIILFFKSNLCTNIAPLSHHMTWLNDDTRLTPPQRAVLQRLFTVCVSQTSMARGPRLAYRCSRYWPEPD